MGTAAEACGEGAALPASEGSELGPAPAVAAIWLAPALRLPMGADEGGPGERRWAAAEAAAAAPASYLVSNMD
jgi:hypothetical protein